MAPKPASPKKKPSPTKKKKLAVKADYGGVYFGEEAPATARIDEAEDDAEDDPLATYRAAAAAAAKAAERERKDEAQTKLFRKIFAAMDSDADGKVDMADVVERVAAGTAQLSHRAQARRPEGAVALQLPMVFTQNDWLKEMHRMASQMDAPTFEANVLGLFACFAPEEEAAPCPAPITLDAPPKRAPPADAPAVDRDALLRELFDAMDADRDGLIALNDFLTQAKTSEEATELRSLFHFLDTTFGGSNESLTFDVFKEGTLSRTPLGRMRDAAFASATRGMLADVQTALASKASAETRLTLLRELFTALDVRGEGTLDKSAFVAPAKSDAEAIELATTFADLDRAHGDAAADGRLTFRKFATGTTTLTPLGRMGDAAFSQAVGAMIVDAKAKHAQGDAPVGVS